MPPVAIETDRDTSASLQGRSHSCGQSNEWSVYLVRAGGGGEANIDDYNNNNNKFK